MHVQEFADINTAINYAVQLQPIQLPQHEQLQKIVAAETAKLTKKLQVLKEDLKMPIMPKCSVCWRTPLWPIFTKSKKVRPVPN